MMGAAMPARMPRPAANHETHCLTISRRSFKSRDQGQYAGGSPTAFRESSAFWQSNAMYCTLTGGTRGNIDT